MADTETAYSPSHQLHQVNGNEIYVGPDATGTYIRDDTPRYGPDDRLTAMRTTVQIRRAQQAT